MRPGVLLLLSFAVASCAELQQAVSAKPLTETAPEPSTPLSVPTDTMIGTKGDASAPYPSDYGVTVKSDGSIVFPQHTMGRIKGSALVVGGDTVLTVSPSGVVKGVALKPITSPRRATWWTTQATACASPRRAACVRWAVRGITRT